MKLGLLLQLCVIAAFLSGCSKTAPLDDQCVIATIESRSGQYIQWNKECYADTEIACALDHLLSTELTADTAVRIAFLNNPSIQAVFEEVGIAHADLVQAGLLRNPFFTGLVDFPFQKHARVNTEFLLAQNFIDILLVPLRRKIAAAEFEQVKYQVAHTILEVSFDVRKTYHSLVAEQIKLGLLHPMVDATDAAYTLAKGQFEAGNVNILELQGREHAFLQAKLDLTKCKLEIVRLREKMNRLLGLCGSKTCWKTVCHLPELPAQEPPLECLEDIALYYRLDLEAARWDVERIGRTYGIKQWWAYTNFSLGISSERDSEGVSSLGPAFSFDLPLFNHGQADRERICALFRQSVDRLRTLEIAVLSEVRSARDQLLINRKLVQDYRNELLPLQQQIVTQLNDYYNSMALSVYKLLHAKMQGLKLEIDYTMTVRDYWLRSVDLDQALDGALHMTVEACP